MCVSLTPPDPGWSRRKVCLAECDKMFYDLDDTEMVYKLDRRHRHFLKENGIIRQGVSWRREELLDWFERREACLRRVGGCRSSAVARVSVSHTQG